VQYNHDRLIIVEGRRIGNRTEAFEYGISLNDLE